MQNYFIVSSILDADFARLGKDVKAVLDAGAHSIHLDVMDNHYVPNLTVGPTILKSLRNYGITAPIEIHLMTTSIDELAYSFIKAGANCIIFHPDASKNVLQTVNLVKSCKCEVGLAFSPNSDFSIYESLICELDVILVMSVEPGFGGQLFMQSAIPALEHIHKKIKNHKYDTKLSVDGGITADNIKQVISAGANTFVIGSSIFKSKDYKSAINNIKLAMKT